MAASVVAERQKGRLRAATGGRQAVAGRGRGTTGAAGARATAGI
jgi:hypothetical protein